EDVPLADLAAEPAEAGAVEERAVGAAQVAGHPALVRQGHLRVLAADRGVLERHLELRQPADAQDLVGLPAPVFQLRTEAPQADARLPHPRPPTVLPALSATR